VEVGGFLLAYSLCDLIEGLRAPGGHGEGHRDLLFGQVAGVQRVNPAEITP